MADNQERTERVTIRVSQKELEMLRELASATGLSVADVVRQLIRERFSKLNREQKGQR